MANSTKKDPYDHTASSRDAKRDARIREEGGKRFSGRLDGEHAKKLSDLVAAGYANTENDAIKKAISEAHKRLNKKN